MKLRDIINSFFPAAIPDADVKKRREANRKKLYMRYSNGNISAQNGRIITSDQIMERKDAISKYRF